VGRTIFIGDVHGCVRELADLLDACAYAATDTVVFVGDLVAKGPDSRGVLALARELSARSVRGNHDHAVLRWREALANGAAPADGPRHLRVARELSVDDWSVLIAMPLFLRLHELEILVVHAGFVPGIALERQEPDLLMNMRTLRADGSGSRRAEDGVLWASRWFGPERAIFGHHATAGLQRHPYAVGLDTGCVYGGKLSAYLWPEDRVVSVPARECYAPIEDAPPRSGA
jgi:diadenosine tetraphosphatase ApaH/serine/threonine PP2A family protein phosphatase